MSDCVDDCEFMKTKLVLGTDAIKLFFRYTVNAVSKGSLSVISKDSYFVTFMDSNDYCRLCIGILIKDTDMVVLTY